MNTKKYKTIPIILLLLLLGLFNFSNALDFGSYQIAPEIEVEKMPKYPLPNSNIGIKIESYTFDLERSFVSFYLNGELSKQGVGVKNFNFKVGPLGSDYELFIKSETESKGIITKTINITPSKIDFIWEADTYTPPFYKGKPLHSVGSYVSIEAMPELYKDGVRQNPEELYYKWKDGPRVIKEGFGLRGKNLKIKNESGIKPIEISLEVENIKKNAKTKRFIEIPVTDPEILFYKKTPLMGILYKNEIYEVEELKGEEITISAEPYFFGIKQKDSNLIKYNWRVNGVGKEPSGELSHTMTLRRIDDSRGILDLSLFLRNMEELLQSDGKSINIKY